MQAIGHAIYAANPAVKVICVTSEKFTNEFITSLQNKRTTEFRDYYRSADVLLIDDIHFIAGKGVHRGGVFPHLQHPGTTPTRRSS